MTRVSAIVVAGGSGKRFGSYKQFAKLGGKPVYKWPLDTFRKIKSIKEIILVVPEKFLRKFPGENNLKVIAGGKMRFDSVKNALKVLSPQTNLVLIHDAARPFISKHIVERAIAAAAKHGASIVAIPAVDTIKFTTGGTFVKKTIPREKIFLAQTPQIFKKRILERAYSLKERHATDDSYLAEKLGIKVKIVPGEAKNLKITTRNDLKLLEFWMKLKTKHNRGE